MSAIFHGSKRTMSRFSHCSFLALILSFMMSPAVSLSWPQAASSSSTTAQTSDHSTSDPVSDARAQLLLTDLLTENPKTGLPLNTLKREDLRIFDNRREVPITAFNSGSRDTTRSIALWFVVICNERNRGPRGEFASGWFSGKEALFSPALNDLDKRDRVGVAHWCDNGDAQLDLRPTDHRDIAISMLAQVLTPIPYEALPAKHTREGELTLQRLIHLIIDETHVTKPQPLPVLLFLHSDQTAMPTEELDLLANDLLETSGIVFGIKDADARDYRKGELWNGEHGSALHYLAESTAGQYFSVHPNLYETVLRSILLQLHFRYELGFTPPVIDGKTHELSVEFATPAKQEYKFVRLRYPQEYIPSILLTHSRKSATN